MIEKIKKLIASQKFKAGFWSIGSLFITQALRLGSNLIMTRMLVPEMFGIMAIAQVVSIGLTLFSDIGLNLSIIRSNRTDDPIFLNTMWSMQIIRGFIIWFIALLLSYALYIAIDNNWLQGDVVYNDPMLPMVIACVSFVAVLQGFLSTKMAMAAKEFAQRQLAILELSSQLLALFVMLTWVVIDQSIWALIISGIIAACARLILSHYFLKGMSNSWHLDMSIVKETINYGKWVLLSSVVGFLFMNGDRLLLGGLISAEVLGIYSLAFMILMVFSTFIEKIYSAVIYPSFSQSFHKGEKILLAEFKKYNRLMNISILFGVGFLLVISPLLIQILYDDRYLSAGFMLQILSISLIATRYDIAEQYYLVIGKPKLLSAINSIRATSIYLCIPLGFYFYDFNGALWGYVLSYFSSVPYTLYLNVKHGIFNFKEEIIVLPAIVLGAISASIIAGAIDYIFGTSL